MTIIIETRRNLVNAPVGTPSVAYPGMVVTSDGFARSGPIAGTLTDCTHGGRPYPWVEAVAGQFSTNGASALYSGNSNVRMGIDNLDLWDVEATIRIIGKHTAGLTYLDVRNQGGVTEATNGLRLRLGVSTMILGQGTSAIGSTSVSYAVGDVVGISCKGNQISMLKNGVKVHTVTYSSGQISSAGKVRIRCEQPDPTGFRFSEFLVKST